MKSRIQHTLLALALLALSTLNSQLSTAFAQGTAFTYQGRLTDGANPATGIYDFRFTIYDAATNGGISGVLTNAATPVTNGLFTVTLDFGSDVFDGSARWLDIGVRTNGGGAFAALTPRQALTATPYAIQAANASSAATATTAASVPASGIGPGTANINISGDAATASFAIDLGMNSFDRQWTRNAATGSVASATASWNAVYLSDPNGNAALSYLIMGYTTNVAFNWNTNIIYCYKSDYADYTNAPLTWDSTQNGYTNATKFIGPVYETALVNGWIFLAGSLPVSAMAAGSWDYYNNIDPSPLSQYPTNWNKLGTGSVIDLGGVTNNLWFNQNSDAFPFYVLFGTNSPTYITNITTIYTPTYSGVVSVSNSAVSDSVVSNAQIMSPTMGTYGSLHAADIDGPHIGFYHYLASYNGTNWEAGPTGTTFYDQVSETNLWSMATNYINHGLFRMGEKWIGIDSLSFYNPSAPATNLFPSGKAAVIQHLHDMGFKVDVLWCGDYLAPYNSATNSTWYLTTSAAISNFAAWKIDGLLYDTAENDASTNQLRRAQVEYFMTMLRSSGSTVPVQFHMRTTPYDSWIGSTFNGILVVTYDVINWDTQLSWLDQALSCSSQYRQGNRLNIGGCNPGMLVPFTSSAGFFGTPLLYLSSCAMWHGNMYFPWDGVAEGNRYADQGQPQHSKWVAMTQTNDYIISLCLDTDYSPPWIAFTNGTIQVWQKQWSNGDTFLLCINRGYATNVTATSITLPMTAFGYLTNEPAIVTDVIWNTNFTTAPGGTFTITQGTNSCSAWNVSRPSHTNFFSTVAAAGFIGNGAGLTNVSVVATNISGTLPDARLSTNIARLDAGQTFTGANTLTNAANTFAGNGSGLTAINASQLSAGTVADDRLSTNVALLNANQTFTATNIFKGVSILTNTASTFAGNGSGLTAINASQLSAGTVADDRLSTNVAILDSSPVFTGSVTAGTDLLGARLNIGTGHSLTSVRASIAGGYYNTNESLAAFIGGGEYNIIQTNAVEAVIGGGYRNTIQIDADYATIGGGAFNTNTGAYAMIPGGKHNMAATYSFAAGNYAQATNTGAFVWGDESVSTPVSSTNADSVTMRASGGYRLFSNSGLTAGVALAPNGTSWGTLSDRTAKKNFQPVNTVVVLDKLAAIPIQQWNYKWEQDSDVPNIGPMAQDFKAAFFPGRDDKNITTLEYDGVELAAIQGLNQKLNEKDAEIQALKQSVAELKETLTQLTQQPK